MRGVAVVQTTSLKARPAERMEIMVAVVRLRLDKGNVETTWVEHGDEERAVTVKEETWQWQ